MAVDDNAYTTTTAGTDGTIPLVYKTDSIIEYLYATDILRDLAEDISYQLKGQAGNTVKIYSDDQQWSVSELTEGEDIDVSALDYGNKSLEIAWYGDAKEWTEQAEVSVFPFVLNDMRGKALKSLGENRTSIILTELYNTTSSAIYPFKDDGTTHYTSSDIDDDAVFQYEQIAAANITMQVSLKQNMAMKTVVAHPYQKFGLIKDSRITNNNNYPANVMINGGLRTIDGVDIRFHTAISTATENSKTVYIALGLMDKPFYWAQKVDPVFRIGERSILNLSKIFRYHEAFGVKLKRNEGIIPMKSVGSI